MTKIPLVEQLRENIRFRASLGFEPLPAWAKAADALEEAWRNWDRAVKGAEPDHSRPDAERALWEAWLEARFLWCEMTGEPPIPNKKRT